MAIKVEMLRCFATVAQTGTLAEAAERLGRTQSAISMTLKQLEAHLGKRLFESDRKNRLTPLGEHVFDLAQTQLRQFDYTVKAIETSAKSPEGLIRLASIPSFARIVFPETVKTLMRRFPGLHFELRDADTQQVVDTLMHGQADIGIVSGAPKLNGVRQHRLFSDHFGLVCTRDHPLARQEEMPTIEQVAAAGLVGSNIHSAMESAAVRDMLEASRVTVLNTLSLITMVRSGCWVTILPSSVVQIAPTELVFRPIAGVSEERQVSVMMREKTPFPELVEACWRFLTGREWVFVDDASQCGKQ